MDSSVQSTRSLELQTHLGATVLQGQHAPQSCAVVSRADGGGWGGEGQPAMQRIRVRRLWVSDTENAHQSFIKNPVLFTEKSCVAKIMKVPLKKWTFVSAILQQTRAATQRSLAAAHVCGRRCRGL